MGIARNYEAMDGGQFQSPLSAVSEAEFFILRDRFRKHRTKVCIIGVPRNANKEEVN